FRVPRPVDRPHAGEQIGRLVRGVVEKFGNDLDGAQRPQHREQRNQIETGARAALQRGEALPAAQLSAGGPAWQRFGRAHWNNLRIAPDMISPIITSAMIVSTMVSTKS